MQRPQHADELVAEAVLERHAPAVDPARDEHDLLVLDVHALDRRRCPPGTRTPRARRTAPSCTSRARAPRSAAGSGTPRSSSRSRTWARSRSPRRPGRRRRARRPRRSPRTGGRRRSGRRRRDRPGSTPMPDEREQARRAPTRAAAANCASPSITPGSSYGCSGWGPRASSPCRGTCSRPRTPPRRSAGSAAGRRR